MLYFFSPEDILGVTVYPASDSETAFYLLPAFPRLRRDAQGRAVFQLTKFVGGEGSALPRVPAVAAKRGEADEMTADALPTVAGEVAGGILTFDTEYTVDPELREQVRAALDQKVRAKYQSEGRVVPEGFQISLRTPSWTDGEVHLLMEETNRGLFSCVSKSAHPSLLNNNVASIAAVLEPWQATLLEASLAPGGVSPIQVNYRLKFLAKLPPVRINIHADAEECYEMYKQYGVELNGGGVCSSPDMVVSAITERVRSRGVVQISIDSGGLTLDDKTFQALQQMALGMLQDWIKTQFYKAPPERATKEQLQDVQLQRLTQSDFRELNINIEQSATVEVSIHPQGTLSLVTREGEGLEQYVREVDLSADEFFQKRRLGIKVYVDFPEPGAEPRPTDVQFVQVTAYYGTQPGISHTWDAALASTGTANGERWLAEWHKVPGQIEVRWEAVIQFRDPDRTQTLKGTSDKTELNIPIAAPGRARLHLVQAGMPWDIIQYVEATVRFRQEDADPREVERTFILDAQKSEAFFDEPIWVERSAPFEVSFAYRLANQNLIQKPEHRNLRSPSDRLYVKTPFDRYLQVKVVADMTNPDWLDDHVELRYEDPANDYYFTGSVVLSERGGVRQTWNVPLLDPTLTNFSYFWDRRKKEGRFTSADLRDAPENGWFRGNEKTVVRVGDPDDDEDMLRVVVDPLIFEVGLADPSKTVIRATVFLKYEQSDGVVDVDEHIFKKGEVAWTWKKHIWNKQKRDFSYWVEYFTMPFSRIQLGSATQPFHRQGESITLTPPES